VAGELSVVGSVGGDGGGAEAQEMVYTHSGSKVEVSGRNLKSRLYGDVIKFLYTPRYCFAENDKKTRHPMHLGHPVCFTYVEKRTL